MFTIKELEDKWIDYESACLLTIKQLLADCKEVTFESDDLSMHPVCIGEDGTNLIDAIIISVHLQGDRIMVDYKDREYPDIITSDELKYVEHVDYIDLISFIKEELKNGKTNLGKEA
jgi:hypothetical protein